MMYLSEYNQRKANAEAAFKPLFWNKTKSIEGMAIFLKRYVGQPYPLSWYHDDAQRTVSIYKKEYAKYLDFYNAQLSEWKSAQGELYYLESLKNANQLLDNTETLTHNYLYPY